MQEMRGKIRFLTSSYSEDSDQSFITADCNGKQSLLYKETAVLYRRDNGYEGCDKISRTPAAEA